MEETHPIPERPYLLLGATALVALTILLPPAGTLELPRTARVAAYALVLISVVPLLHGFILAARGYTTPRLLALGAAGAALGALFALLARPEDLEGGSGFLLSFALSLANLLRILAAASVGISLARYGLGVSDFVFLALFAAASRFLDLRYPATLLCTCFATFLAVTAGLLLERPLPALPFIAIAFVLVNADLILASLTRRP